MFSRILHMLGYKTRLNKLKRIEIIPSIFSNIKDMNLEIHYREKNGKNTNTWRLNNMLVKNHWVKELIKEEIRKYLENNENKSTSFQNSWDRVKAV